MKKVTPFIDQVKVLSQVFSEQDDMIKELKKVMTQSEARQINLMEATFKRNIDQATSKFLQRIDSLEIQIAASGKQDEKLTSRQSSVEKFSLLNGSENLLPSLPDNKRLGAAFVRRINVAETPQSSN